MLIGEYNHTIDEKGRIIIPAKIRDSLGENFVLTKGLDGCLFAYGKEEWENLEEKLKSLPLGSKEARSFQRYFFSGATLVSYDKQGRIVIPSKLREHATLDKEVVIVGVSKRIEIWDKDKWDSYIIHEEQDAEEISEKMALLGI